MNNRLLDFLKNVKAILINLLGEVHWTSPCWIRHLQQYTYKHQRLAWLSLLLGVFLAVAGYGGYRWYQALPKPELITAEISAPAITPLAKQLTPESLKINFGIKQGNDFITKSVAPLSQVGKVVNTHLNLSPAAVGEWRWENDQQLIFTPKKDWPADQQYQIKFEPALFTAGIKLAKLHYEFKTQPLIATITELKLYQDPQNPKLHQVVATINFNFPIDTGEVEDHLALIAQQQKNYQLDRAAPHYKFTLRFDEHKRTAYLQSEAINLTDRDQYLILLLDKGVKAAHGKAKTTSEVTRKVLIPNTNNLVNIQQLSANIVRNEQDRPEQTLIIETSLGMKSSELLQALQVYALPTSRQWDSPAQVSTALMTPENKLNLQALPTERAYATLHSFKFNAVGNQQLYVKIAKGIRSEGDYVLSRDYLTVVTAPAYPQEINFLHKGALLALNSERKLSVLVRGVPAVKFEVARILANDINHLITQTQGDFSNPQFIHQYTFNEKNISKLNSEIKIFNQQDAAKLEYTAVDLNKYLSSGKQNGLFLLKAQSWDIKNKYPTGVQATRLILMTDMGLLVKDNSDGSHEIFVVSITQGVPINDVQIQVLGKNGEAVQTLKSDNQGHAHIPSLKDFHEEREPVVYIARKGDDLSFIPYHRTERQLNYSRYDVGGEQADPIAKQLTALVFTDRGIYRPGDDVHVAMVVKQAYAQPAQAGIPVEAVITDPRGMTVLKQKYTTPTDGYFTVDFKTTTTSLTGAYNVDLYIIHDGQRASVLGSTAIQLEEFLPDRLRIKAQFLATAKTGWISPTGLKATVNLWNLFGTPATDRKVTAKIILKPKALAFKKYPQYIFVDPLLDPKKPPKVITEDLINTQTNNQGIAEFALGLAQFGQATYELNFYAQGFEAEGGRSVATQNSILVSPLNYLVGYKTDGDLNYLKQHVARRINFIAVDAQLKAIKLANLQAKLIALRQVSSLVKKPDGTFAYQSVLQEQPLSTQPLTITEQGIAYTLPSHAIGNFALAIVDVQGLELSRVKFSVVGASNQPLPKNAELAVKLNKSEYNPGENIELQITAPYAGAGLITIERDKVYNYRWFKMEQSNSVQTIPIPQDFMGNGYVNVALMRDWNSAEIFLSPLSYSVSPFTVNRAAHHDSVELKVSENARPGEPLAISYKTATPSKIIVYAVDEGILQVTHYIMPKPLDFFFRKQALAVTTAQTLDQILPKFIESRELSSVGGDMLRAANLLASNINPFKRKVDKPVVFWSGIIDADNNERKINYHIPDYFNGSLKVMAIAVATNAVGSAAKSVTVKGDFVINPNVPTFVAPGDEFTVSAGIANLNAGNAPLTVSLTTAPGLAILGPALQQITIPQGQEQAVQFKLRAKAKLGAADLNFKVSSANKQAQMKTSLSIRPANAFMTTLMAGFTSDKIKRITLPRQLYTEHQRQEIAASPSPLILVRGLQRYLENFPYSCTEQLISKAFTLIAFAHQPILTISATQAQNKFAELLQILRERQLANGGFSYWPGAGEGYATEFASVYTMHFLTEAKQLSYAVPADLFENGLAYLREVAAKNAVSLDEARVQAYAIYLLTRNEMVTSDYLTNLQLMLEKDYPGAWRGDLIAAYMGATYQLLQNQTQAQQLIAGYKMGGANNISYNDFYNPVGSDAQFMTLLAKHFPQGLPQLNKQVLLSTLVDGGAKNKIDTLSAAYTALALKAYDESLPVRLLTGLSINTVDKTGQRKLLANIEQLYQAVPLTDTIWQLEINNANAKPYFYLLTQAGFDLKPAVKDVKQGLEIYREYRDAKGNKINQIKLGEEIEVHIQTRSLVKHDIHNVAIVDLLPGGFEVSRDSVNHDGIDYADIREDRVLFFTTLTPDAKEIVYKIKATNAGKYTVPPITAAAMYDAFVQGQGVMGRMEVK